MWVQGLEVVLHSSQVLANNPMGNNPRRPIMVLHPPPMDPSPEPKLIFYVLSGYFGNGLSVLNDPGPMGISFGDMVWKLQREGQLPPSLFVFPDASTVLGGSQYINSSSCGYFFDYISQEVIPFIENGRFSFGASRRVIVGHSSGGYGALVHALFRPDLWGGVVASAADSAFDVSLQPLFPQVCQELERCGGVENLLKNIAQLNQPEKCSRTQFNALMMVALASCYAPRPQEPHNGFGALPLKPSTGELIPSVWEEWQAWDLVHLVHQHSSHLKDLWHIHLDCGSLDECGAQFGHRRITKILQNKNIFHKYSEFKGGHSGTQWRWPLRFLELAESFKKTF